MAWWLAVRWMAGFVAGNGFGRRQVFAFTTFQGKEP